MAEPTARVLVLDDDPFMCEALAIALGSEGYDVRTETDGTTINQSFSEFRPSVAVVDVNLGDGPDGFSVTRRLRAMSDLPVILVSASTSVEDRLSGFSVGGDDFMVKPFSMAEMLDAGRGPAPPGQPRHQLGDRGRRHPHRRPGPRRRPAPARSCRCATSSTSSLAHLLPPQRPGALEGPAARRGAGASPSPTSTWSRST